MKFKICLFSLVALAIFTASSKPVNAEGKGNIHPTTKLVRAIESQLRTEQPDLIEEAYQETTYSFIEVDLNNDGITETIVAIRYGSFCSNRYCRAYVFQKTNNAKNYRLVSSSLLVSRQGEVAILRRRNHGWANISTLLFTYEPREINWWVFKFNGEKYEQTEEKLSSQPSNVVLDENSPIFQLKDGGKD